MSCRLTLFGPPRLLDDQGRLVPVPSKTFALVAYLLLTGGGGPSGRGNLRHFLWENADPKTAATNLRKFLQRLRERQERFGVELIDSERSHVSLAPSASIDLADFLRIVSGRAPNELVALCRIYRGDLLDGLESEESESREWLQVQRTKLREAFVAAVASRLEGKDRDADSLSLRSAARRLIEVDAYNEAGHRALMQLFAEEGEPARVQEVYRNLQNRLLEDLGVEPDVATTELYRSLLPTGAHRVFAPPPRPDLVRIPAGPIASNAEDGGEEATRILALGRQSGVPRITIMPPTTMGAQDFRHQLAGSLVEDVTIGLCRLKALSVVAPHTAWELSTAGKKALFRAFHIDYAVETQLLDHGTGPLLAVKLLTASDREIVWTDQFAFSRELAARNYRDLSARIVLSLSDGVERAELGLYEREPDASAYHLYLLGKRHLRSTDLPSIRRARRVFRNALNNCPDFVPAVSGLARTFQLEWLLLARNDNELLAEAEALAYRALEIDSDDARGHREIGVCHLYAGRFDESLYALDQAERRNPQFADLIMDHSDALLHAGQATVALQKLKQAIEMNPLCPDTYWWAAGGANYQLHRYQDAVECLSRMRDPSPVYRLLAASFAKLGERERAREYVRMTREIHPDFSVGGLLSLIPFRDPSYAKHYEDGLREAGFD